MHYFTNGKHFIAVEERNRGYGRYQASGDWNECSKADYDEGTSNIIIGVTHFYPMYAVAERPEGHERYNILQWCDNDYWKADQIVHEMVKEGGPYAGYCEFVVLRDHDSAIMLRGTTLDQHQVYDLVELEPYIPMPIT